MKFLVTGGAGFIGSHLVDRLLVGGHLVMVLDNSSTGNLSNLSQHALNKNLQIITGSILDTKLLHSLVDEVDYVFHLAAAVGVFNIINNPIVSLTTNIQGTQNILVAGNSKRIPVFLSSSSEVYGKNNANSLLESDDRILGSPTTLRWSYSEAKAIDDELMSVPGFSVDQLIDHLFT